MNPEFCVNPSLLKLEQDTPSPTQYHLLKNQYKKTAELLTQRKNPFPISNHAFFKRESLSPNTTQLELACTLPASPVQDYGRTTVILEEKKRGSFFRKPVIRSTTILFNYLSGCQEYNISPEGGLQRYTVTEGKLEMSPINALEAYHIYLLLLDSERILEEFRHK
jgi:hypothetical protein